MGLFATTVWLLNSRPHPATGKIERSDSRQNCEQKNIEFDLSTHSELPKRYQGRLSGNSYKASDGIEVTCFAGDFDNEVRATRILLEKLKRAVKIVERNIRYDENGNAVGERVVALFSPDDPDNGEASVFWTYDRMYETIDGPTLEHVLRFEEVLADHSSTHYFYRK